MSPRVTSDKQKMAALEKENKALKAQLEKVKTNQKNKSRFSWKLLGIILATGLAGAMLVVGNLIFWTGRTITDNQRYVEATQPLIQNQAIQEAIANKATTAIFDNVNIEQLAQDALPPRAQFLAPSIATQVKSFTNAEAKKIVASSQFQDIWQTVNARSHERLLNVVKNYQGDGTFDINDLYARLSERLQDSKLSFLANKTLPSNVGSITIISTPNLPKAHWIVVNLWWIRLLSIGLFVLLTVAAVWLAKNRRKTVARIGLLYAVLMLVTLLALRITKTIMVGKIAPDYQAAAIAAWDIILKSLLQQTAALLLAFIGVSFIAWVTGGGKQAKNLRERTTDLLNGRLHQALFKNKENKLTIWIGAYKRVIGIIFLTGAALSLLIIRLKPINIAVVAGVLLVLMLLLEALSATKNKP